MQRTQCVVVILIVTAEGGLTIIVLIPIGR
jgi:hypothetical protein